MKFSFAPELPPGTESPLDFAGCWWVAQVGNRNMAEAAEWYARKGIAWCVPQTIVTTRYTNRTKRRKHIPLFQGYMPCCVGNGADGADLYPPRGIVHKVLQVSNQIRFVSQLDAVFAANKIEPLDPWPWAVEGRRCRVRTGEFQGTVGVVIRREDGTSSVILELGKLGGAAIPRNFTADELEPVD